MNGGSGSPLQARMEVNLFKAFFVIALLLGVICLIFITYRFISVYYKSEKYQEKRKNKPTSWKNIVELSKQCNLTKEEKEILWEICKIHRSPNILYVIKTIAKLEPYYKEFYNNILISTNSEEDKTNLFSLRNKLHKAFFVPITINNTKSIDEGTELNYSAEKGLHYRFILKSSTPDGMYLSLSPAFSKSEEKPQPLEKIRLSFIAKDGSPFEFETRILRYQAGKDFDDQALVVHTDRIRMLERRKNTRISIKSPCQFSAAKQTTENDGKNVHIKYEHSEKFYDGFFEDVSVGGCSLISALPIKAGQFLFLQCSFNGSDREDIFCQIIKTTKRRENVYVLHIRFIQISPAAVNRINAEICGYGKDLS